ncbi:MAG: DUF502 domain-containing protein [Alphaproteobacteria bacterium]
MSERGESEGEAAVTRPRRPWRFGRRLRAFRTFFRARLRAYFFTGILITAPAAITIWLAWEVIRFFDHQVRRLIPARFDVTELAPFQIPGFGLLLFIIAMMLIGAFTANLAGRYVVALSERILASMPVVRSVYGAMKQIFETVLAQKSEAFRQVVLIEYPRRGMWALGFVSGVTEGEIQNLTADEVLNVFLPTTPNPTSGYLLFVPRRDVIVLGMTVEEGIKMVVSGGIVTPPDRRPKSLQAVPVTGSRDTLERGLADEEAARARLEAPARGNLGHG